jgi:hypothetical protein
MYCGIMQQCSGFSASYASVEAVTNNAASARCRLTLLYKAHYCVTLTNTLKMVKRRLVLSAVQVAIIAHTGIM